MMRIDLAVVSSNQGPAGINQFTQELALIKGALEFLIQGLVSIIERKNAL